MTYLSAADIADATRLRRVDPEHYDWDKLGALYQVSADKIQAAVEPRLALSEARAGSAVKREWTEERVESLKQHWRDGLSASLIAKELGGVTRNAVISKLHRTGLTGGGMSKTSAARVRTTQRRSMPRIRLDSRKREPGLSVAVVAAPVVEPLAKHLSIVDLERKTCRWPHGDRAPFTYCGWPTKDGSSWCPHHHGRVYQTVSMKRAMELADKEAKATA